MVATRRLAPAVNQSILVTDSNSVHRRQIVVALENAGFQVIRASSCHEALSICRQNAYPILALITKIEMPDMSGINLARAARRVRANLPVFYISERLQDASDLSENLADEVTCVPSTIALQALVSRVTLLLAQASRIPPTTANSA
ncbi:MAG: response regulator [Bryobacteraceae bacterium]